MKISFKYIYNHIKGLSALTKKYSITGYAAQSCFYITLSFLPFLMVIMNMLRYLPVTDKDIISILKNISPSLLTPVIEQVISDIYSKPDIPLLSITAFTAIWSSGKGFMSVIHGLNTIYGAKSHPSWIKLRIKSTIYTVLLMLIIVFTLSLLVFGNLLIDVFSVLMPDITGLIQAVLGQKIVLFPSILTIIFTIIFTLIPDRKSSYKQQLPGAAITALGWYLFSNIYSVYADFFPGFSYVYKGLTVLIFGLLWIYFSFIIMFFGAVFNVYLTTLSQADRDVPG